MPVDAYGVGSSLIRGSNDFTADVVLTDGRPSAKVGRRFLYELSRPGGRLFQVEFDLSAPVEPPPPPWGSGD